MRARTVTDVILGEAVSGTPQQRYRDMLGIASVIHNRARSLGTTPEKVIGVRSEFNAYGKSLPKGVDQFRNLAEQAWNQVTTTGPIHDATFYATPKASSNLPNGLQPVDQTAGHVYYSDPQGRAIRTMDGFVRPNAQPLNPVTDSNTQFVGGIDVVDLTNDIPYARTATRTMQPFEGAVIHHSEPATLEDVRDVTNNPRPGGAYLGYTYAMDPAGNIGQLAPLDVRTNHIGQVPSNLPNLTNANSLGITMLDAYNGFTPQQVQAAGETIAAVNRAGNLGFIDPDTGIGYHGKGATLTRPVEGMAEAQAVQEYLGGLPFGPFNTPVPTPKPDPQVQQTDGIMAAINPPTPMPVESAPIGPLSSASPSAAFGFGPEASMAAQADVPAFDQGRFGPMASASETFDNARFGPMTGMNYDAMAAASAPSPAPVPQSPSIADFSPFSTAQAATMPAPAMPSMGALADQYAQYGMGQQALLADPGYQQKLSAANLAADVAQINPNLQQPIQAASAAPAMPGYTDPMVTTQAPAPAVQGPAGQAQVATQAPSMPSMLSAPEAQQIAGINANGGTFADPNQNYAVQMERQMNNRRMMSGLAGGLLGGLTLGPLGAIAGGMLGRTWGNRSFFPDAPSPVQGASRGRDPRGSSAYRDSGQFRDAVDSGSAGLW